MRSFSEPLPCGGAGCRADGFDGRRPVSVRLAGARPGGELFVRRLTVHIVVVAAGDQGRLNRRASLLVGDRADARGRRQNPRALNHAGHALWIQQRDERLTDGQFGDRRFGVE